MGRSFFTAGRRAAGPALNRLYLSRHTILLLSSFCFLPLTSFAQDEAFLQCANFAEREARVRCLESALEQAVNAREATRAQPASPATAALPPSQRQTPVAPAAPAASTPATSTPARATAAEALPASPPADPRRFDLFGLLDREEDEQIREEKQAADTMHANVAELDFHKPDVLTITLDNGQVWRQRYARRYHLRQGDAISIYQSGWGGNQFRLEAERFNGFIQVERLR